VNQGFYGWSIPGGGRPNVSASLAADVSITSGNTFFDGPGITLFPGTWLVLAQVQLQITAQVDMTVKIWDGTTAYASGDDTRRTNTDTAHVTLFAIVSLLSVTTLKVSAAAGSANVATIKAAAASNSAGNNATQIAAISLSL
jgi:hypothetical protein